MIIFITSSYKTLGAMKVNNLFIEASFQGTQSILWALSNSEAPQHKETGKKRE